MHSSNPFGFCRRADTGQVWPEMEEDSASLFPFHANARTTRVVHGKLQQRSRGSRIYQKCCDGSPHQETRRTASNCCAIDLKSGARQASIHTFFLCGSVLLVTEGMRKVFGAVSIGVDLHCIPSILITGVEVGHDGEGESWDLEVAPCLSASVATESKLKSSQSAWQTASFGVTTDTFKVQRFYAPFYDNLGHLIYSPTVPQPLSRLAILLRAWSRMSQMSLDRMRCQPEPSPSSTGQNCC